MNLLGQGLDLTTPSLLFSAISLILLAYTNRFLGYAQLVRTLRSEAEKNKEENEVTLKQIENLVLRLELIKIMQILGASSLLFCTVSMFFIYIGYASIAEWIFSIGMILLALSLVVCIWEINISVKALYVSLHKISNKTLFGRVMSRVKWYYSFAWLRRGKSKKK